MSRRGRTAVTAIGATALLLLVIGGVAVAAAPGSNNVIKGCYATKGGALKVVSSTARCPKGYKTLSWNVKGRTGATGKTGPKGAQGVRGVQGVQGPTGPQGPGALRLSYKSAVADYPATTLLATSDGFSFYGQCVYDASVTKSATVLYLQTPANTTYDLTGPSLSVDKTSSAVIVQSIVTKYAVAGGSMQLLTAASGLPTTPHTALAWGPMTLTARAADGSVTTFAVTATLTTDARDTGVNANEGRCRIDGSVTPTS